MNTATRFGGAESAARIVKYLKPESECGFGLCAGDPICKDRHCPGHPCQSETLTLPVVDAKFLDEETLNAKLRNSCLNDWPPTQYAEPEPDSFWTVWRIAAIAAIVGGLLIAAVIYATTK